MSRSRRPKNSTTQPSVRNGAMGIVSPPSTPLFYRPRDGKTWFDTLMKSSIKEVEQRSHQGVIIGRKGHPFDMRNAAMFGKSNPHHAAAIDAKKNATTGLGFVTPQDIAKREMAERMVGGDMGAPVDLVSMKRRSKAATVLDPLCSISFQDLWGAVGEDLATVHNGYIEVLRKNAENPNTITGLHHMPASEVNVIVENSLHDFHFEQITGVSQGPSTKRFARFGDKANFMLRAKEGIPGEIGFGLAVDVDEPQRISEVIHLRYPSALNRHYGIPTWLSGVAAIELIQALHQAEFDFYNNRGVPEFLLFLLGKTLDDNEWNSVKKIFQGSIGLGNTRKSGAFNFAGDVTVQLEKLALEGKSDGRFSEMLQALSLEVVTSHRIPPLLAGIQTPGKLGANNELPNALLAYQTLVVAPDQASIQSILGCTLGEDDSIDLTYDDFELRTIMDVFDFGKLETMSRMRQTQVEADAEGRDMDEGVRKSMSKDLVKTMLAGDDPADFFGTALGKAMEHWLEAAV